MYFSVLAYSLRGALMLIFARLIKVYCIKEFFFEGSLAINANEEKMQTLNSSLRKSPIP